MKDVLPTPKKEALIYDDEFVYACLASFPIIRGHTIVVWKKKVADLHLLTNKEYEYLMGKVDAVRTAMLGVLHISKVYLMYMDEVKHVHWHLIPRYDEKGFTLLTHKQVELKDYSVAGKIKEYLTRQSNRRPR